MDESMPPDVELSLVRPSSEVSPRITPSTPPPDGVLAIDPAPLASLLQNAEAALMARNTTKCAGFLMSYITSFTAEVTELEAQHARLRATESDAPLQELRQSIAFNRKALGKKVEGLERQKEEVDVLETIFLELQEKLTTARRQCKRKQTEYASIAANLGTARAELEALEARYSSLVAEAEDLKYQLEEVEMEAQRYATITLEDGELQLLGDTTRLALTLQERLQAELNRHLLYKRLRKK
ncbi:hypothetical protein GMRT_15290 [Giardia muris]|uniref:Uncharacterized protein n=1 Tax=Giardia muris TaxID=5742 RepID=A0A4Z1T5U4_GIAMU|nr:hypothetical protein GMRT_15290 [Giardia muris]|eukprot:TNJ27899.1 hypothetical protein GMRT_15290 [Giardia muris]